MNALTISDLTFKYPGVEKPALSGVSFSLKEGEVLCISGDTGCGKSTLLRQLKPVIAPHGDLTGSIRVLGKDVSEMSVGEQASRIGFVMQDPDNQIVTDKVWHELAFGLENLGMKPENIRLRVAETAGFFGIGNWYEKSTGELSGGQKQILALASVMVTCPDLLVLDEPTARLDPVAAGDFLAALRKVNRELGTTIVIAEHRMDEILSMADRLVIMKEGKIGLEDLTRSAVKTIVSERRESLPAMPMAVRAFAAAVGGDCPDRSGRAQAQVQDGDVPVDAAEGRAWVSTICRTEKSEERSAGIGNSGPGSDPGSDPGTNKDIRIQAKNIWFRYRKNEEDVIQDLSLKIREGESVALVGGNGAGKSTLFSLISKTRTAYRGKVRVRGSVSRLPQDPRLLFTEDLVEDDIAKKIPAAARANARNAGISDAVPPEGRDGEGTCAELMDVFGVRELFGRHPYDLSGGEQQRVALCEVLGTGADIYLLDEPTKGLDAGYKKALQDVIHDLRKKGKTIVTVSHDMEFVIRAADRCLMMFRGDIISDGQTREVFCGNSFYTTQVNRMAGHIRPGALLPEDIADLTRECRLEEE